MSTIFATLATLYSSAAQCAAALGMSRQAYCQAAKRRRLSERKAMLAGALIGIDPGRALFLNATGKDPATPEPETTSNPTPQIQDEKNPPKKQADSVEAIQIMRGSTCQKKRVARAKILKNFIQNTPIIRRVEKFVAHHLPLNKNRQDALDYVKWMLCVPRISPDSPRFVQYFSRWRIPDKVAASKLRGDFAEITKDCPLFSPELLNYIQAGIDEYHVFAKTTPTQKTTEPLFDSASIRLVKVSTIAA